MLRSIFRRRGLKPTWSLETSGTSEVIWKLLVSPQGILVGEERDVVAKTGSLFALEIETGRILWRGITVGELWWFGTERVTDQILIVQTFRSPELPEAKGIIVLDLLTGKELWQRTDLSLLFPHESSIYAMKQGFSARLYYQLNAMTGELEREFGEDSSVLNALRDEDEAESSHSTFASSLREEDEEFSLVKELLANTLDVQDLRGSIEYLEHGTSIVISFHARAKSSANAMLGNMLRNELVVLDRSEGEVLLHETLATETPLPLPDNFFVDHQTLIYVKERHIVAGVRLP